MSLLEKKLDQLLTTAYRQLRDGNIYPTRDSMEQVRECLDSKRQIDAIVNGTSIRITARELAENPRTSTDYLDELRTYDADAEAVERTMVDESTLTLLDTHHCPFPLFSREAYIFFSFNEERHTAQMHLRQVMGPSRELFILSEVFDTDYTLEDNLQNLSDNIPASDLHTPFYVFECRHTIFNKETGEALAGKAYKKHLHSFLTGDSTPYSQPVIGRDSKGLRITH